MIFMDPVKKHFYTVRGVDRDKVPRRCREVTKEQMSKTASSYGDWELYDLSDYCIFDEMNEDVLDYGYRTANEARFILKTQYSDTIKNEPGSKLIVKRQADVITYL